VLEAAGPDLPRMLAHAAVVCAVVIGLRALWMTGAWLLLRRSPDASAAPRTGREAVVLTWCGMRGLATLALALALPTTTVDGAFPAREELVVIACSVLLVTLIGPGLTLPVLVRLLGVQADADAEQAAEKELTLRARRAALTRMAQLEHTADMPEETVAALHERMGRLEALLRGDPPTTEERDRYEALRRGRALAMEVQVAALAAAREEVLAARREPGVDPEAADRVLHRLDLRTVLLD
jgi:CPA1 family monovalent cation:H+ antiporter